MGAELSTGRSAQAAAREAMAAVARAGKNPGLQQLASAMEALQRDVREASC